MAGIEVEDRGPVRLALIDNQPTRNEDVPGLVELEVAVPRSAPASR